MTKGRVAHYELNGNQLLNALVHILAADPTVAQGRIYYHSGTKTLRFQTDTTTVVLGRLDQVSPPTADVSMNSQKLTNLANGVAAGDAVNLSQVQALVSGVAERIADPVVIALTSNVNTASPGATLDGRTMVPGDVVLLTAQTTATENDFWMWNGAAVAMTRQTTIPVIDGTLVGVELGTGAGKVYVQRTTPSGARGTWAQDWAQFGGGGTYAADGTTLALTGSTFSLISPVAVANGGTGATTPAGARTNLGVRGRFEASIGDGAATSFTITHNLGTRDVLVQCYDAVTFDAIEPDVNRATTNTVVVSTTGAAPAANAWRVVIG